MKGFSSDSFEMATGSKKYRDVLIAIKNLSVSNIANSVSMVLNHNNINYFLYGVQDSMDAGAENFYFSFEFDFPEIDNKGSNDFDFEKNVFMLIDGFCRQYDELCTITSGKFILHESFPLCIWPQDVIATMRQRHQIHTICQVLERSGILFDTNGDLIVCNAMYEYPIGQYKKDFSNGEELGAYLSDEKIDYIYKRLSAIPSQKCMSCDLLMSCGGGCISNWTHFSLDELLNRYRQRKNNL